MILKLLENLCGELCSEVPEANKGTIDKEAMFFFFVENLCDDSGKHRNKNIPRNEKLMLSVSHILDNSLVALSIQG